MIFSKCRNYFTAISLSNKANLKHINRCLELHIQYMYIKISIVSTVNFSFWELSIGNCVLPCTEFFQPAHRCTRAIRNRNTEYKVGCHQSQGLILRNHVTGIYFNFQISVFLVFDYSLTFLHHCSISCCISYYIPRQCHWQPNKWKGIK